MLTKMWIRGYNNRVQSRKAGKRRVRSTIPSESPWVVKTGRLMLRNMALELIR